MNIALITGSREELTNEGRKLIDPALEWADFVILGDCPTGVDAYVDLKTIREKRHLFTADWDRLGKRAGPERNGRMVAEAVRQKEEGNTVVCFAFPTRTSKGTWDCLRQAARNGIQGRVVPL